MTRSAETSVDELALSEAAELYLSLGRIMRALRRAGDAGSLSPGAGSALATLARSGPQRLGDLAAAERVTAPTMSRIVASLEQSGHVARTPDPTDKRASELSATEQGRQLVNGLTSERIQHLARVLDRLGPDQRKSAGEALDALETALAE